MEGGTYSTKFNFFHSERKATPGVVYTGDLIENQIAGLFICQDENTIPAIGEDNFYAAVRKSKLSLA